MSEVFVSYKRENLAAVGRLVEALQAEGVGVWWDQDIAPNAAWEATIETALATAKLVIVAWSPAAVASENVKAEARWARQQGRLLQVFVEDCEPPLFFGERQGVDLARWSGAATDAVFRGVLAAVREGLAPPTAPTTEPSGSPDPPLPLPSKPSIAVMPFANLSGDPEQAYFADGMVEEIVAALSRFKSIFVIGSGSTLSFKGAAIGPREVARSLGVRYVLEGSVRKAGGRVRIAVKLTDAADGAQIWADRFDDTLDDVFALQDNVALTVAGVIEPAVLTAEIRRASKRPTEHMGGYDLYLRAVPLSQSFEAADVFQALDLLDRAVVLDPDFGPALALAAQCHQWVMTFGWSDDPQTHRRRGIDLARRAVDVGGDDANVLAMAANVMSGLDGDLDKAISLADRAMALNPGASRVWLQAAILLLLRGEPNRAIQQLETALRLDPLSPRRAVNRLFIGIARFQESRFAEALAPLKEAVEQVRSPLAIAYLAAVYGHLGQAREARAALARYRERASAPLEKVAFGRREDRRLFLDGIALAEGETPKAADDP